MNEPAEDNQSTKRERRGFPRRKISIPIRYRSENDEDHVGHVHDISNGGMFFESDTKHKAGEKIQADLDLEIYGKVIWAHGNVVHVSNRGAGVMFTDFDRLGIDEIMDISTAKSEHMKQMTAQNLMNAFGGESQAHMRYLYFASQAEKEKYQNVARLFRAVSHAEYVHAGDYYRQLKHLKGGFMSCSMTAFGPGDTKKNLDLAIMGETYEINEVYPVYIQVAKFQDEKGALRSFEYCYNCEKEHRRLFEKAVKAVEREMDVNLGNVVVCNVCGFTIEGEIPDKCPLCNASKEKYTAF